MASSSGKKKLDPLDTSAGEDESKNQTVVLHIYKKTNRLKNKIKAIQIASKLGKAAADPNKEEKKKPAMEVYKAPDCLKDVLLKIKQEKRERKENISAADDKLLNEKFHSSLFLENLNMGDIHAVVENNHAGNYEIRSDVRYDKRSGNVVMHTKMYLKDDASGAKNLIEKHEKGNTPKALSAATPKNKTALSAIGSPIGTARSSPYGPNSLPAVHEEPSPVPLARPASKFDFHAAVQKELVDRAHTADANTNAQLHDVAKHHKHGHDQHDDHHHHKLTHGHRQGSAKKLMDHNKLLFPHVLCLDGNIKSISHDDSFKYFGDEARVAFFEQYRRMCAATTLVTATMDLTHDHYEEPPTSANSSIYTNEFGEDDASHQDGFTVTTNNTDHQGSVASFKTLFQKDPATASSTRKVTSVMNKLNSEYYSTFQSMVSKDAVNRSVDREILSHNSFKQYQLRPYAKRKESRDRNNKPILPPIEDNNTGQRPRTLSRESDDSSAFGSYHGSSRRETRTSTRTSTRASTRQSHQRHSYSETHGRWIHSAGRSVNTQFSSGYPPAAAMALNEIVLASPRTKYISGCLRDSLQPMPNLILRKKFSTAHNLAHYGIGDKMGCVLAECLADLPHIEAINLADNNLTDVSLKHLIQAIINIKSLQDLDLSRNKIDGESSDALAEYLSDPHCPVTKLTLQSADVDDGEADRFVQCLCSNEKLLELDLSSNLLGTAESASMGDASIKTGGASLAEFISSASCKLQVLKVSWNSIRLNSAVKLTKAVAFNNTLTYLDLSSNGMGFAAGEALGDAIMENRTLKTLLVAGNNFTSTSCLSMCVGVVENLAMKNLNLNDNPIGEAGAKMIMQTSIVLGSRVNLTAANCNTNQLDENCWYDPGQPCRDYELQLDLPFHRAVAFHLMQIVATHSTLIFSEMTYEPPNGKPAKLKLVQSVSKDREKYFDEEQVNTIKGLRLLLEAASNTALGTKLFYEADADNSGRLDKDELQDVLDKIGFHIDTDRLQDILAVFDVDGAGTIDLSEFQCLLKSQHHEAASRIKEMVNYPILALSTARDRKYVPPRSGVLRCKVVDGFVRKKNFYTISAVDQKYAFKMAKGIGDVLMMTEAVRNSKMRMNEAFSMFKMMYKERGDKAEVLVKVLPQMMYPHEARQLVSKATHDDRVQLARLKAAFGIAVRPMFGAYNGYYCLDLSKDLHRVCFARLLEQSQTMNAHRASASIIGNGRVGDTSQHGNWTAFRNEYWNGKPAVVTPQMFTPMPHSGILEFDFSGGTRPTGGELRLTDKRMCKVLINLCVLHTEDTSDALRKLHHWQHKARETSKDKKYTLPMYQMRVEKALEMGLASDDFYDNLAERREILRKNARKEEIKVNFMEMASPDVSNFADEMQKMAENAEQDPSAEGSADGTAESDVSDAEDGYDSANEVEIEGEVEIEVEPFDPDVVDTGDRDEDGSENNSTARTAEDESLGDSVAEAAEGNQQLAMRQKKIKEIKHRLQTLLATKRGVSKHAKASRFVEAIEEAFQQLWILSRHLALLVQLFQRHFGDTAKTPYFGSYSADIVVLLFSRVIDLHNFEVVLEVLSARDCACVHCRIGHLNIFNPMKPDVTMELDMNRREERVVAKLIVYLSVDEPGINLTYKRFQWKREIDPIPGWDVTEPWMTEEGMPDHGKFAFTYYSGEGKNKNGCKPNLKLRRALCHMVLIDENEIIDEDAMLPDELICTAEEHLEQNRNVWSTYLVPGCDKVGRSTPG